MFPQSPIRSPKTVTISSMGISCEKLMNCSRGTWHRPSAMAVRCWATLPQVCSMLYGNASVSCGRLATMGSMPVLGENICKLCSQITYISAFSFTLGSISGLARGFRFGFGAPFRCQFVIRTFIQLFVINGIIMGLHG